MGIRQDHRAQSVQIGATILLAFVVIAISLYQAQVVPQQNEQVEFNHNQIVRGQMQEVRNGVVSVPGGGSGRSVTMPLGTNYPERTIFVNPGPPGSTLRTAPAANLSVANATAAGEAGDFWTGDPLNLSTRALVLRPNYNVYGNAPVTVYENSVLYDRYRNRNLTATGQRLVDDRTITLVTLVGEYGESTSDTVAVDLTAASTSSEVVQVTNETGENVTVTVPTALPEARWRSLLDPELVANGGHVQAIRYETVGGAPNRLTIQLEQNESYRLRMAKVGIGSGADSAEEGPAYLTAVGPTRATVEENTTREFVVEVRDRFNNPVSGVDLNLSTARPNSSVRATPDDDSDADGRVTLVYEAPEVDDTASVADRINVSYVAGPTNTSAFDGGTAENVSFSVSTSNTDGSGIGGGGDDQDGSGINPNRTEALILQNAVTSQDGCSGKINCTVKVTFANKDSSEFRNITDIQYSFYSVNVQSATPRPSPKSLVFNTTKLVVRGTFQTLTPKRVVGPGGSTTVDMRFYKDEGASNEFNVEQGDFYVIRVVFENGERATYFIAPEDPSSGGGGGGGPGPP